MFSFLRQRIGAGWYLLTSKPRISVSIRGRGGMVYGEGSRKMRIRCEWLVGPTHDITVDAASIVCWEPPFEREEVTYADRKRICANISHALGGYKIAWEHAAEPG